MIAVEMLGPSGAPIAALIAITAVFFAATAPTRARHADRNKETTP